MIEAIHVSYVDMSNESLRYATIYAIQAWSGARISEVLNIGYTDIVDDRTVLIRALKHSRNRICTLPFEVPLLNQSRLMKQALFPGIDRFRVYRFYKRYGIYLRTPRGKNNKVTHKLRYDYILKIKNISHSLEVTQDLVGHKSKKTTEGYLRNFEQINKLSK